MNPCSSVVVSMMALASITDSIRACPKEVPSSLKTQSKRGPAAQYGSTPMYVSTTPKRRTNEKVGLPSRTSPARENPWLFFVVERMSVCEATFGNADYDENSNCKRQCHSYSSNGCYYCYPYFSSPYNKTPNSRSVHLYGS
jgi:hypothetical protein